MRLAGRKFCAGAFCVAGLAMLVSALTNAEPRWPQYGYDADSRIMEVEFSDGLVFRYFQVPEGIHRRLMRTRSKAAFFRNYIHYQYWCSPRLT